MSDRAALPIWYLVILGMLPALLACSARPDLRIASNGATPNSIAEGRRLLEEGRAVEAVSAFRALLRRDGDNVGGLNGLAIAYSELGKRNLAAEMFGRALARKPNDPATLNNIGFAALRRADVELARHYLERAGARTGTLDEISGNLKGLALVEEAERELASRRASLRTAYFSEEFDHEPTVRLSIAEPAPGSIPSGLPPPAGPNVTLVDFAAVIDPFSGPWLVE